MFDRAVQAAPTLRAVPTPALPVESLMVGKPVAEAAALLPRLFNLCRAAQSTAACLALDLPDPGADIAKEIRRDHVLKLFLQLPGHFGANDSLPANPGDPARLRAALFGPVARAPSSADEMAGFLASGQGLAPLLARLADTFPDGIATTGPLPLADDTTARVTTAVENSPAARRATHPALRLIEARHGRGMLWRVAGRMLDLAAVLDGDLQPPRRLAPGLAQVPATRGLYTVAAHHDGGRVTAFSRVTPTDHLLAPGGVLERCLATLPADRTGLAPLMLEILDPCSPVRLEEVADA